MAPCIFLPCHPVDVYREHVLCPLLPQHMPAPERSPHTIHRISALVASRISHSRRGKGSILKAVHDGLSTRILRNPSVRTMA